MEFCEKNHSMFGFLGNFRKGILIGDDEKQIDND